MLKKNWLKILPLIFLSVAIALSPSFVVGQLSDGKTIEIRIEDVLIAILGLVWIANLIISRKKIGKIPLFFPILVWLGFGFLSTLTNLMFGNLEIWRGFFYFLKEVEFFLFYFYFFYYIKNVNSAKFLIKFWIFLAVLNVGYVAYQIIIGASYGKFGEYGTGAICEWGVFPSGAFFLILFIFLLNVFLYYFLNLNIPKLKKGLLGIAAVSPIVGVFGSCSKTNFLAVLFALFLTMAIFFLRNKSFRSILVIFLILTFVTGIFIVVVKEVPHGSRMFDVLFLTGPVTGPIDNFKEKRLDVITEAVEEKILSKKAPLFFVLGFGKGYVSEAHNQYVRNFIETGIIGSIIFLVLIFAIIKKALHGFLKSQDNLLIGLSAGLLVATFAMLFCSFATEPFIVVKPSEVYWVFAAITMAVLSIKAKENKAQVVFK